MQEINRDRLRQVLENAYAAHVSRGYGIAGMVALKSLMPAVIEIFNHLDIETINWPLYVCVPVTNDQWPTQFTNATRFDSIVDIFQVSALNLSDKIICLLNNGTTYLIPSAGFDPASIANEVLIYKYEQKRDSFIINGIEHVVPNTNPLLPSTFYRPTFTELEEVVADYAERLVAQSTCYIFRGAWVDEKRIFFINGPESTIRDSLTQHLRGFLRTAEVQPEQNVDETKPVDIKVIWTHLSRAALIEIKWLGKSKNPQTQNITATHPEARARAGAKQLADYLDRYTTSAPTNETYGYLVVIDGRRQAGDDATTVTPAQGLHYENAHIAYDPQYHLQRSDFKEPVRIFAYPVCN